MSCSILIDTILAKDSTPADLAAAFKAGFEKEFAGAGISDISPSACPKYSEYFPGAVTALANACLAFGRSIHAANHEFPAPTLASISAGLTGVSPAASPDQIFAALKESALPRLFDYLRESLKWCRDHRVQVDLDRSLTSGFVAEGLLVPEWDLIIYLNFAFPSVPAASSLRR